MADEAKKELQHFLNAFPVRALKKDQTILFQGEVPRQVYIIKEGAIRAYNIDASGEEKTVAFVGPNEVMAPSWAFGRAPVALYYYDVFVDTKVYLLSRDDLLHLLQTNPDALYAAYDKLLSIFIGATIHINALEKSKSSQKLINLLQYLCMRFGVTQKNDHVLIDLRLTQHDLASMLGVTRETVATELSRLKKQGVLSYQRQRYLVNSKELQKLHGEEEFYNLSI